MRYKVEIVVEQEEIVMEQKMRFGLGFGRLAILKKKSKGVFKVFICTKKRMKIFFISVVVSKKRSNQKIRELY